MSKMDFSATADLIRSGRKPAFSDLSRQHAQSLDECDPIRHLRDEYIFPTRASLKGRALRPVTSSPAATAADGTAHAASGQDREDKDVEDKDGEDKDGAIYFCGNSLGLQCRATRRYIGAQLDTWASIGVNGHFTDLEDSPLVNWQDMAAQCAAQSAGFMGALASEIVYMNTLTTNIHLLLAAFYRPTEKRHKIILEWKPFPSDYYAIHSHMQWHGLDPARSMVEVWPAGETLHIPTSRVLATIDEHADDTALILLPGIQYYSGQLFDMATITRHAQARGIVVGWDLAHAAGNVDLSLHEWNVDFAMWCTYKYINAGPGSIAGAFVHERHGRVEWAPAAADGGDAQPRPVFRPRLSGWYGGDKSVRFQMAKQFQPTPGAGGFQVGNPSALDLAALSGALSMFDEAGFANLRDKSLVLTCYAEAALNQILADEQHAGTPAFTVATPADPAQRGAQLSILLRDGLLDTVLDEFAREGIVCDKRKPDVLRVAPVPMYNTFDEVWRFMEVLRRALGVPRR